MPALPTPDLSLDGRRARSTRTQRAVASGMLACLEDGHLLPTAKQVAARADVSVRAVFRHFDDLESLFTAVSELQYERVSQTLRPIAPDGPLGDRVSAFVREHARINERIAPVRRAAVFYEHSSPAIAGCRQRLAEEVRAQARTVFAPELARLPNRAAEDVLIAVSTAVGWSQWEELRTHAGLGRARARRIVERQVGAVLGRAR